MICVFHCQYVSCIVMLILLIPAANFRFWYQTSYKTRIKHVNFLVYSIVSVSTRIITIIVKIRILKCTSRKWRKHVVEYIVFPWYFIVSPDFCSRMYSSMHINFQRDEIFCFSVVPCYAKTMWARYDRVLL